MMYTAAMRYNQYRQQGILTANPVELIVMLYDGCLKNVRLAETAIDEGDPQRANTHIQKAQDIVMELINSLDLSYQIAKDLMNIYDFVLAELTRANAKKDKEPLAGVTELLTTLRQTWQEISKEGRGAVALAEE